MLRPSGSRLRLRGARWLRSPMARIVGDGTWTLTAKIISQVAQIAAFILAARTLTSHEFGFYAYSSAFALLFVAIAEGGWGEFVLNTPEYRHRLSEVATIAIASGGLVTMFGLSATAVIDWYFQQPEEAAIIALFSCWILPSALSTVYDAVIVAEGRLRDLALIRILGEAAGFAVVVLGILSGWGVVSFVAGRLAYQLLVLAASIVAVRWLPAIRLDWTFCRELLAFSRHIVANRFIILFRSYSATILVGSFLGLAEAGYYRAAERIVAAISELVGEPARILAWFNLRKAAASSDDPAAARLEIGRTATSLMTVLVTVSLPIYVGLALIADPLVRVVLGDTWAPTATLLSLLALKQVLLIPGYVTEPLLTLSGNIRRMPPAVLINSLVGVGLLLALAPFGMLAAALGQCAASVVSFLVSVRLQSRYGSMRWDTVLRDCSFSLFALLAMIVAVITFSSMAGMLSVAGAPSIALQVAIGTLIYFATLAAGHRLGFATFPVLGPRGPLNRG
ncbi:MAG: oligosaccharide flippase family protein [Rhizobium sp.]|nr:oligosaccharide flippase family protein [Rhizobium sp.]